MRYGLKPQISHTNGDISIRVLSKVSITKRLITSATINIFPSFFLQLLEDLIPEKLIDSDF